MGWPMPDAGANDPARGRLLARRSVTARRSFFSWSQTVAEPGHERARLAADLYAPASAAATSGEHADRDDLRVVASLLGAGLESSELPRGRTPPWALAGTAGQIIIRGCSRFGGWTLLVRSGPTWWGGAGG